MYERKKQKIKNNFTHNYLSLMYFKYSKSFLQGGSGYAKQITFDQIILENVMNPIIIDQEYSLTRVHILLYIVHIISCQFNNFFLKLLLNDNFFLVLK